jgi:anti-sigma28 factor (negative regulator of flagellin synthesis)
MSKTSAQTKNQKKPLTDVEREKKIAKLKDKVRKGTYVLRTEIVIDEILSEGLLACSAEKKG